MPGSLDDLSGTRTGDIPYVEPQATRHAHGRGALGVLLSGPIASHFIGLLLVGIQALVLKERIMLHGEALTSLCFALPADHRRENSNPEGIWRSTLQ